MTGNEIIDTYRGLWDKETFKITQVILNHVQYMFVMKNI